MAMHSAQITRNVLLINSRWSGSQWPHYGLVLLATKLKQLGHNPLVVDYNYTPDAPGVAKLIDDFRPDIIGFSLYTIGMQESRTLIAQVRSRSQIPVILGGPHASLYQDELVREHLGDWLFIGDAEQCLPARLNEIKVESHTVIIKDPSPDINEVPKADFNLAWGGYSRMVYRPIQLSRGCPYACSFCSVKCITSRKIRYRDASVCLDEIQDDIQRSPALTFVRIVDDCPTFDLSRFKQFLRDYTARGISRPLHIDNLRGDGVDDEMLELLKIIGVDHLCIGVESGNREVFNMVNKGETLEQIVQTAQKIKRHGIRLYTCFIIGLPGASPAAEMDSIRLVRQLRPDWVYWNMFQPHKGTKAREWFEQHGRVYTEEGKTSIAGIDLSATEAPCETPGYTMIDRSRMQLMAMLMTGCYLLNPFWIIRMSKTITHYHLWKAFWVGLPSVLRVNAGMFLQRLRRQIKTKQWGDLSLLGLPRLISQKRA